MRPLAGDRVARTPTGYAETEHGHGGGHSGPSGPTPDRDLARAAGRPARRPAADPRAAPPPGPDHEPEPVAV